MQLKVLYKLIKAISWYTKKITFFKVFVRLCDMEGVARLTPKKKVQ